MKELNFDTGLETYKLNGKCEISFNPTDPDFVGKLYEAFEDLDKKQEGYKSQIENMADKKEIFKFSKERDAEMREIIDDIFGAKISDLIFESNVYSMAAGLPIWANFILAIMDEVDTTFAREQKATNPRIAKYTAKYHR